MFESSGLLTEGALAYMVQGEVDRHLWVTDTVWYVKAVEAQVIDAHGSRAVSFGPMPWLFGNPGTQAHMELPKLIARHDSFGLLLSTEVLRVEAGDQASGHLCVLVLSDGAFVQAEHREGEVAVSYLLDPTPYVGLLGGVLERAGRWGVA